MMLTLFLPFFYDVLCRFIMSCSDNDPGYGFDMLKVGLFLMFDKSNKFSLLYCHRTMTIKLYPREFIYLTTKNLCCLNFCELLFVSLQRMLHTTPGLI